MKFKVSGSGRRTGADRTLIVEAENEAAAARSARIQGIYPQSVQPLREATTAPPKPSAGSKSAVSFPEHESDETAQASRRSWRILGMREVLAITALAALVFVGRRSLEPAGETDPATAGAVDRLRETFTSRSSPPADGLDDYQRELLRVSDASGHSVEALENAAKAARRDGIQGTDEELLKIARRTLDARRSPEATSP